MRRSDGTAPLMQGNVVRGAAEPFFLALVAALCLSTAAEAQLATVTTSLLGRIDSKQVVPDSPFFVKVTAAWKDGPCRLNSGETLEGRVVTVEHRGPGVKKETIALRLQPLPCADDKSKQILPILVALDAAPERLGDGALNREAFVGAFGSMVGTQHFGGQSSVPSGPAVMPSAIANTGAGGVPTEQPLRTAEVRGIAGVKLSLPALTSGPTGLSGSHQMIFVPGTRFVLAVRSQAQSPTSSTPAPAPVPTTASATTQVASVSAPPLPTIAAPPPEPDEPVDVPTCVAGGCALADSPPLHTTRQAERQFSLHSLGYRTRGTRMLRSLTEDAAIRFLGEDQVVVAFDTHALIRRSTEDADQGNDLRVVRALLVSVNSGKVLRAQDWRIESGSPYLWPLRNGRLLAHVGSTLIVYGPGLTIERKWELPGRLAWLRVSPSRNLLVAVVIRERHTPEQHRRLAAFLGSGRPVEEDYDLTVLDDQLSVVGTKHVDAQPELAQVLDSGLLFSEQGTRQRWSVFEIDWNQKRRSVTQVHSSCPLRMETLPTDLVLLVGCSPDGSHSWYSMLRTNGQTLLNGATTSNDWLEDADAMAAGSVFAISVVDATEPIDFIAGMRASDFQKLAVSVYDATTGRRLFAAQSSGVAVNRQSFALSEFGDRLAMLSGEDVSLYKIGDAHAMTASTPSGK